MIKFSKNKKIIGYFILAIVLFFVFMIVYSPHLYYDYPYPLHYDEWLRISEAKQYIQTGAIIAFFPFAKEQIPRLLFSVSFDVFLAEIELMSGFNLVNIYQYLPAFFAVLLSLGAFVLSWQITNNYLIALLSIFFIAFLKSNINLLGIWFFLYSTFSLLFIFIFFYLLNNYFVTKHQKYLYLFYFFSFIFFGTYPIAGLYLASTIVITFFIKSDFKSSLIFFINYFMSGFLVIILYLVSMSQVSQITGSGEKLNNIFMFFNSILIFFRGWSEFDAVEYFFPAFFGYAAFFFVVVAIIYGFNKPKKQLISYLAVWSILNLIFFKLFNFTLLAYYQRVLYMGLISFCILAPLGLDIFFKKVKTKLPAKSSMIMSAVVIIVIAVVFYQPIVSYYDIDKNVRPVKLIDYDIAQGMDFLQNNYKKKVILAPALLSITIHPMTGNYVVNLPTTVLAKPILEFDYYNSFENFASRDDEARKIIIDRFDIELVYSPKVVNSEILNLVYEGNNNFIYEVAF